MIVFVIVLQTSLFLFLAFFCFLVKLESKKSNAFSRSCENIVADVNRKQEQTATILPSASSSLSIINLDDDIEGTEGISQSIFSLQSSSTLTDLYAILSSSERPSEDCIPRYKLRADTFTHLIEPENQTWYISTPLIDSSKLSEISPKIIEETLQYFLISSNRLSQMTKTYNDIEAVTQLLEEKERDLELAAHIGQSLLQENKELKLRNQELEAEILNTNETITQLKHDITTKNELLQIYSADLETNERELDSFNVGSARDKSSLVFDWNLMNEKINHLEKENHRLRTEASAKELDIELEEKKEVLLIHDCARQLTEANIQLIHLQDELSQRAEDSIHQQQEITNLLTQTINLQKKIHKFKHENENLQNAIDLSHECQAQLASELSDLKEKYNTLLYAYHEVQETLKRKSRVQNQWPPPGAYIPLADSLAAEIETSLESESCDSGLSSLNRNHHNNTDDIRSQTPDSVISNDSGSKLHHSELTYKSSSPRSLYLQNKLKVFKPMEGSEILSKWRKFATPHLGAIFETQADIKSKINQSESFDTSPKSESSIKEDNKFDMSNYTNLSNNTLLTYTYTTSQTLEREPTTVSPSVISSTAYKAIMSQDNNLTSTKMEASASNEQKPQETNLTESKISDNDQNFSSSSNLQPSSFNSQSSSPDSSLPSSSSPSSFSLMFHQLLQNRCSNYVKYLSGVLAASPKPSSSSTPISRETSIADTCQLQHLLAVKNISNNSLKTSSLDNFGSLEISDMPGLDSFSNNPDVICKRYKPCFTQNTLASRSLDSDVYTGKVTLFKTLRKGGFI